MVTFTILLAILLAQAVNGEPLPAFNLQCDRNLVGLSKNQLKTISSRHHFATDNTNPVLSWSIAHTEREATQSCVRVLVSRDRTFTDIVWDSGKIYNYYKQEITYNGEHTLEGGTLYLWKVIWWDQDGVSVTSEEIGHFLAVTLTDNDWNNAHWISAPENSDITSPTFAKNISTEGKGVSKATLYISGLGFFRALVSGADLHKRADPPIFLAPGWTNYEIRVPYMVFDITELMNINKVPILITLAQGWRNTSQFPPRDKIAVPDNIPCVLRLILTINFKDSTEQPMAIYSDESWDVLTSKFGPASIYDGEVYNAQTLPTIVGKAVKTTGPSGQMYLPLMPYIAQTGIIDEAINITLDPESINDHYKQVVDFGYNTAGVVAIKVSEIENDQALELAHAEVMMHPPYGKRDGSLYFANLRSADQLDDYTANGKETMYQPTFTYHGFRYVLVVNYPRKLLTADIHKIRVNTNLKANSNFSSSNELLNNIQQNVIRGQLSNLMSVPTDCDQRDERLGWMGDAGLSADSMALNFHMESFFPHRTMLMKDEQINGSVPDVVPFYHGGGRPSDPSWGAAYPQTVWVLWKYYGDLNTAKTYYASLLEYIDFVESQVPSDGIGGLMGRYGDWVPPPPNKKIDNKFPSAFSFMKNIQQMMDIANAIGDTKTVARLKAMFDKHADEFNKAFYQNNTWSYIDDIQISYVLPLELDIVPSQDKEKVITNFLNRITADKNHVTSGIVGVKFLLPVLSKLKQHDLAVTIATQVDYPSWGYMIHNSDEPATAIWELWNSNTGGSGMNSRNHHMFSSISSWMLTDMIGLMQQEGSYGYQSLDLYPASSLEISRASITLEYPKEIKYAWHRRGGIQCGKAPEDQSVLNPTLPKHGGLKMVCGEGAIIKVQFASYGNPIGTCGYHHTGTCHSVGTKQTVEKLCLNKTECVIPTGIDFWSDPCPGLTKWLTVAVLCSTTSLLQMESYSSLQVNVSVPIGSIAHLNVPSFGMSKLKIWDNNVLIYNNNVVKSNKGMKSIEWQPNGNHLLLKIASGNYNLTIRGNPADETRIVNIKSKESHASLKCSNDLIITNINWVSYGNPLIDNDGMLLVGTCHSTASHRVVEESCIGRNNCIISMKEQFGTLPCDIPQDTSNFIAKYSCNIK